MNLLVKRIKRVGFGFRNFRNYRLRLLLHCGMRWDLPPTTKIRGRAPSFAVETQNSRPRPDSPSIWDNGSKLEMLLDAGDFIRSVAVPDSWSCHED